MTAYEADLKSIYLSMISEAIARLRAAQAYLATYNTTKTLPDIESAILQVRKSLEATAFAAIAPNKSAYASFRAKAEDQQDYRKDYHAGRILDSLSEINKDFYPLALLPATQNADGSWNFERKMSGCLTKKRFETFYDCLGKHLHADNPWGNNKNLQNIINDIPNTIEEIFGLLELHVTFIQTPEFHGAWIVEAKRDGTPPRIVTGTAEGEFIVESN
jgi:hypothetical protein